MTIDSRISPPAVEGAGSRRGETRIGNRARDLPDEPPSISAPWRPGHDRRHGRHSRPCGGADAGGRCDLSTEVHHHAVVAEWSMSRSTSTYPDEGLYAEIHPRQAGAGGRRRHSGRTRMWWPSTTPAPIRAVRCKAPIRRADKALGPCPLHLTTFDLTRHGIFISGQAYQSCRRCCWNSMATTSTPSACSA